MKKYLLTACYLLLTYVIFKSPIKLPENDTPTVNPKKELDQNFSEKAIAKKLIEQQKKNEIYLLDNKQ